MTRQKQEIEVAKTAMLKTIRTAVRLKHSLAADKELNTALPEAERLFDEAVSKGELPDPTTADEFLKVLDA